MPAGDNYRSLPFTLLLGAIICVNSLASSLTHEDLVQRVDKMNASILRQLAAQREAAQQQYPAVGSLTLSILLQERAQLLKSLIRTTPAIATQHFLSDEHRHELLRIDRSLEQYLEAEFRYVGSASYLISDSLNEGAAEHTLQITSGNTQLTLPIPSSIASTLSSEHAVDVTGVRLDTLVAVSSVEPSSTQEAIAAADSDRQVDVFPVTFPGRPLPDHLDNTFLYSLFFDSDLSLFDYWRKTSYGALRITGTVHPPLRLTREYSCSEYYSLWADVLARLDSQIDFMKTDHAFLIFPKPTSCKWTGMSTVGRRNVTTNDGVAQLSISWLVADSMTDRTKALMLAAHEGGHALGLTHASSRRYPLSEPLGASTAYTVVDEYGDSHSAMGRWSLGHYSARHKLQLGWLRANEVLNVEGPGTFSLKTLSSFLPGLRALRIKRAESPASYIWLESREPNDRYESTLPETAFSGLLVHYEDDRSGLNTNLLDFTPATASFDDSALHFNSFWQDPYFPVSLSVQRAIDHNTSITVGAHVPPCSARPPTVIVSPKVLACATGQTCTLAAWIKNNDTPTCQDSSLSLSLLSQGGLSVSQTNHSITLAPLKAATVRFSLTPSVGALEQSLSVIVTRHPQEVVCTVTFVPR